MYNDPINSYKQEKNLTREAMLAGLYAAGATVGQNTSSFLTQKPILYAKDKLKLSKKAFKNLKLARNVAGIGAGLYYTNKILNAINNRMQ